MRSKNSFRHYFSRRTVRVLRSAMQLLSRMSTSSAQESVPRSVLGTEESSNKVLRDLRSGINVALLAFPQGMAYALVAGLPIQFGITCSIVAALLAPFFSGSRYPILGPTNATAFMIFSYFLAYPDPSSAASSMPLVVLMVAILLMTGSVFKLGDLIQYVSRSVIIGYVAGAALLIIANQFSYVLGIDPSREGRSFFTIFVGTVSRIGESDFGSLFLGLGTFAAYFILRRSFRALPTFAISLLAASVVNYFFLNSLYIDTFNDQKGGGVLPDRSILMSSGLFDKIAELSGIAFGLAFLVALEISVVSKSLISRTGDELKMNRDLFGSGIANVGCAFFSGMVASGSLTRSALNYSSGAATKFSSVFSALFCGAGLWVFLKVDFVDYIPKCSLAALVIAVAMTLINWKQVLICLLSTRSDAATFLVTFISALIMPLHVAIFIGAGTAVALFLRKAARPELVEYDFGSSGQLNELKGGEVRSSSAISIVHVEGELFFGAAELFRNQIQATASDSNLKVIILRMKNARHLDATSVIALEELVDFLKTNGRDLIISGVMKDVYRVLKNSGAVDFIGKENIFPGSFGNPNLATRNALKRAQEIIGSSNVDVKIFHDPSIPAE
ncbi:MAG: SulP family inorganic anion transporter [Verrucomicrobiota bacterium]|nr:SulP family inorganic anion transporter [Verrucomicrobiota bacterium]